MKRLLESPALYQLFQNAGGFFEARVKSIRNYLTLTPGQLVFDIGCGPGYIVDHLPAGIRYIGFDIDRRYIEYARGRFGHKGSFYCCPFDDDCARTYGPADVVMMNGVIHHLDDGTATTILRAVRRALTHRGIFFSLESCFRPGQPWIARWLLKHDRGRFVRTEQGYLDLYRSVFDEVDFVLREDLSRVPYTFSIARCRMLRPEAE